MKKVKKVIPRVILSIIALAILLSILWISIRRTMGTEIKVAEVDTSFKIKLLLENKAHNKEENIILY